MIKRRLLSKMMKRRRQSLMTEKGKKRRNSIYLPEDLLVEILSRAPEASLARFRSTSKGWNALIKKDERLAKKSLFAMVISRKVYLVRLNLHGIHDNNVVKVISQFSPSDPLPSCSFDIRHVFHCDGLLLCTTMDNRLVVWNPCSGETNWIIKPLIPYNNYETYALGKSTSNNEYKILRVTRNAFPVEYELYDFTSNSWRVVGAIRDWFITRQCRQGTSVDGNTYWLTYTHSPMEKRKALRCFDFSTERFGCVSLPGGPLSSYQPFALSVTGQEQKLCMLTSSPKILDIDVWMGTKIKSSGDMSWSKLLTVKGTHSQQLLVFRDGMSFSFDRAAKVLLHPTKLSNCLHIVGENNHIKVDLHDVGSKGSLHVEYTPTLVQIQQGSLGLDTWKAPVTKFS